MLEDGEIGEDDFTTTSPIETPTVISTTSPTNINELNNQKSKSSTKRNKSRELDSTKRHKKRHHHHKSSKRDENDEDEDDQNEEELNDAYNSNFDDNEFNDNEDDDENNLFTKNDYDSRLDNNSSNTADSIFNLAGGGGDQDERDIIINNSNHNKNNNSKPKYPSLMSTTVTSSWSTPMSKKEIKQQPHQSQPQQQQPKSLLDLFLTSANSLGSNTNNEIIDPVLIEKENKPNKFNRLNKPNQPNRTQNQPNFNNSNNNKRKNDEDIEEKLISTDSIEKKLEKKRKYLEIAKEKQKIKELKQQQPKEPIVCKFFQEGRCQKGSECPFSHNVPLNKKFEICKYYLNGYCAKEEKCLYMHSEFPCKFFHRKNFQTGQKMNQCLHGDACRFSHQIITNPLLQEAFEKHLAETENNESKSTNNNKTSLLGSPPQSTSSGVSTEIPSLMNISIKTSSVKTSSLSPPSSPPQPLLTPANSLVNPLMGRLNTNNEPKKQPLLATPPQPLLNTIQTPLMSNPIINPLMGSRPLQKNIPINNNINKPVSLFNDQDVDERAVISKPTSTLISANIPLNLVNNNSKLLPTNDVDERSIPATKSVTPEEPPKDIKQELIIKIMKSLADESGGVFAQIPKQTLTELLVKLLNSSNDAKSDGTDVIINLLTTLSQSNTTNPTKPFDFNDEDKSSGLNESSSNLQIDLTLNKNKSSYDDYDDDDDDYDLIIEGQIDDMPYKLIELDVEPSRLWHEPPQLVNVSNDPLNVVDQESDPRIKYYNNLTNITNVSNFQQQLIQQQQSQQQQSLQQQIQTPTSPSSSSNINLVNPLSNLMSASASSPSGQTDSSVSSQTNKQSKQQIQQTNRIADPRLLRNQNSNNLNNMSPTRSGSPLSHDQLFKSQNDLISIQNRQITSNSLLSSLPDLQLPSVYQKQNSQTMQQQQQQQNESNTVKLSIEDYKRKLQKPSNFSNLSNNNNKTNSISSSIFSSINSNDYQSNTSMSSTTSSNSSNTPSLPSIPSYLQAPQSLHELLRNFQS